MKNKRYYFSHDLGARNDWKMMNLRMTHGMAGLGVYWCIVEMLYEEDGYLPLECERIAFELRTDCDLVKSVLNDFGLFIIDDGVVSSESVVERIKMQTEKSKKATESASKRWDANAMRTQCDGNAIKEKKRKEKKEKINTGTDVPRTLFKPPEQKEVRDYITAQGWDVDADRFVAFYESKGWMIGKNKMKNWKAAVKTWQYSNNPKSSGDDEPWIIKKK